MANNRRSVIYSFALVASAFLSASINLSAQISIIDTSDYIPLFYNGALEYNLMTAASKGYAGEVVRMIKQGAEVDAATDEGATPLIFAISNYRLGVVKILLENNADPNKGTGMLDSPILITVKNLNSETAGYYRKAGFNIDSLGMLIGETLIKFGADIDFQDRYGTTALNYSAIQGYFTFADMLIYYGADIEKKSWDGTTPLMSAIWAGYDDVADLLIRHGANMEARDQEGYTPFLIAAQNGDTLLLHSLKTQGVDIFEKTNDNWDALDIAIRSGQKEATVWLIRNGDKWRDKDRKVIDYLSVAANYKREEIFTLLKQNNFPVNYRFHFNQLDISLSEKLAFWDNYTCFSFALKEPRSNMGLMAGFDTKLWYTRILINTSSHVYYQYYDKSSFAWAGLFKDFNLSDNIFKSNLSLSCSLTGGYFFGNKYKGTDLAPEGKFKLSPGVTFKVEKKNSVFFSGIELMTTGYSGMVPIWLRAGYSYKFFFDFKKAEGKKIKWY